MKGKSFILKIDSLSLSLTLKLFELEERYELLIGLLQKKGCYLRSFFKAQVL